MSTQHHDQSSAEKRALSQIRQRHNIVDRPKKKHTLRFRVIRTTIIAVFLGAILLAGIFGYKILAAGNSISTTEQSILAQLSDLLFKSGNKLEGETENQINILLLAIGGEGHSGENLADTIMIASIKPKEEKVALFSIPRDLYVQIPDDSSFSKLNAVHAYGEARKQNGGPELMTKKVEEITGLKMHYFARVDFTAFKKIVEAVGGVNIHIENGFTDYLHKIAFPTGTETMNGDRALAYVRARYIEGPEGGDFKRAARQQQMLLAIRDKVFSVNTALNFSAINGIINSLSENIRSNMQLWEMKRFFELARLIDTHDIKSVVLTTGSRGTLVGETVVLGGVPASVLKPRTNDYSEIQALAKNMFSENVGKVIDESATSSGEALPLTPDNSDALASGSPIPSSSPSVSPTPEAAKPTVEVRNGTPVNGLAKKNADALTAKGYKVLTTGNASSKTVEKTIVYAPKVTQADEAQKIASSLNASAATTIPSDEAATNADILVILGADSAN